MDTATKTKIKTSTKVGLALIAAGAIAAAVAYNFQRSTVPYSTKSSEFRVQNPFPQTDLSIRIDSVGGFSNSSSAGYTNFTAVVVVMNSGSNVTGIQVEAQRLGRVRPVEGQFQSNSEWNCLAPSASRNATCTLQGVTFNTGAEKRLTFVGLGRASSQTATPIDDLAVRVIYRNDQNPSNNSASQYIVFPSAPPSSSSGSATGGSSTQSSCGNHVRESGENCANCPVDVPCGTGACRQNVCVACIPRTFAGCNVQNPQSAPPCCAGLTCRDHTPYAASCDL